MSPGAPVFVVGCGDIGRRVVSLGGTSTMVAVVRSDAAASACRALGVSVVQGDLDHEPVLPGLADATVLYLVPPPRQGITDPRIRGFLARHGDGIRRLVLVSTTGVYGDCGGRWIDEDAAPAPATDRARRRYDAEQAVGRWAAGGGESIILRVPGIYAADRLPLARLRRGLPVLREAESPYTNRIHADDLARICRAAMTGRHAGLVLNATDGHPTTMTTYFNRVADAVGLPRPPQVGLDEARKVLGEGMLSYLGESRRIGNRRLREVLGVTLDYPDLKTTLAGVVKN